MTETAVPFDDDEGFEITSTGLAHLRIDGVDYWLRRPKIGQMRAIEEAFIAASEAHLELVGRLAEATAEATDGGEVAEAVEATVDAHRDVEKDTAAVLHAVLDAWRLTVSTLEREQRTLPDEDDDLPGWLGSFPASNAMRQGWRRIPWLAAPPQ